MRLLSADDAPVDALQILEVGEVDHHPTALGAHLHVDPRVEVVREQFLEFEQAGRKRVMDSFVTLG